MALVRYVWAKCSIARKMQEAQLGLLHQTHMIANLGFILTGCE